MNKNKKTRESYRFYISQSNNRSCSWIIWSNKNDLYVSTRNIGGLFKASLHESGFLNFSLTKEYFEVQKPSTDLSHRHIGSQKLNISLSRIQKVLKIEIPLNEMLSEDDSIKEEGIENVEVPSDWKGVITVFFVHFPEIIRSKFSDYKSIPNFLKSFCNGKYVIMWEHHPDKIMKDNISIPGAILGEVKNKHMLREITVGYNDDITMGGFIDRKVIDFHSK